MLKCHRQLMLPTKNFQKLKKLCFSSFNQIEFKVYAIRHVLCYFHALSVPVVRCHQSVFAYFRKKGKVVFGKCFVSLSSSHSSKKAR